MGKLDYWTAYRSYAFFATLAYTNLRYRSVLHLLKRNGSPWGDVFWFVDGLRIRHRPRLGTERHTAIPDELARNP